MNSLLYFYKKNLNLLLLLGIVLAIPLGLILPEIAISLSFLGQFFLRLLTLLIVPIIFISILAGILQFTGTEGIGRMGLRVVIYYTCTTALAVVTGLVLVNLIAPGSNIETPYQVEAGQAAVSPASDGIFPVLEALVPKNIIQAAAEGNVLGLIFFTTLLGIALLQTKSSALVTIKQACDTLFNALIWLVDLVMLLAPIGVCSLVASLVAETAASDLESTGIHILHYSLTVLCGLGFHALLTLPLLLWYFKIDPLKFLKAMFPALVTAFSTASSAATLPVTLDALEERAGVSKRTASFVAPLGVTVNMDGTAIYEAVAAVFIANMYAIELSFGQQVIVFLTATFSAVGAAGIPGAGLVMMTVVLNSVGLPLEGISLIVIVDRILDMFRTSVNVWGDAIGAAILDKIEPDKTNS